MSYVGDIVIRYINHLNSLFVSETPSLPLVKHVTENS